MHNIPRVGTPTCTSMYFVRRHAYARVARMHPVAAPRAVATVHDSVRARMSSMMAPLAFKGWRCCGAGLPDCTAGGLTSAVGVVLVGAEGR
eukprot:COSAG02_NODE_138_length_34440_cov_16.694368_8_plen_91_part_00